MALILLVALSNAQFILPTAAGYVLESEADDPKWTHYGASAGGDSYSSAEQINRDNVADLEATWTFYTEEDAGQTIFHCHIHLTPRRKGDVKEPRGGIRHLIPGKGSY